jgi:hypothetical protein
MAVATEAIRQTGNDGPSNSKRVFCALQWRPDVER